MLIRNGVPEHHFVNEIAERGFYDGCKSLDADIDCELFLHCFNHKKKKYIALRRGKHRIPTVIAEEDKFCMFKFPSLNIPILEDLGNTDSSFSKLPMDYDDGSGNNLLEEILN